MKTKIFLAFIIVIFAALMTNFVFEWLIIRDFDGYVQSVKEDQFYWILASVEGGGEKGTWDRKALAESIHWAMMMGLEIKVLDPGGREIISSSEAMESLSGSMMRRMHGLFHVHQTEGPFETHPLVVKGKQVGAILSRPFHKETLQEKEHIFKRRAKNFIYVSFLIAGSGALLLALLFSQYLTKPLTILKKAAEKIAKGDFSIHIQPSSRDEVGELSATFNTMAAALHKEEELRKHLMSNIAHELRTPLTIMKAHIEAVMDGVIDNREKGLETIHTEIDRLVRLVKGIEDITTAEASFFGHSEKTEVDLHELLSGIADEMRPLFQEKNLDITVTGEKRVTVMADVEKLEMVIQNIVSNALKYTEAGGAGLDYGIKDDNFFVEIKDSGNGIPDNKLPLVFNRFYRVEDRDDGGLGLGLAIVKELVDVMGGKIEVKSKVGEGTSLRVNLPRGG